MKEEKKKKRSFGLTHSAAAKTVAFILCILMLAVTAASLVGAIFIYDSGVYYTTQENMRKDIYGTLVSNDVYSLVWNVHHKNTDQIENTLSYKNIAYLLVVNSYTKEIEYDYNDAAFNNEDYFQFYVVAGGNDGIYLDPEEDHPVFKSNYTTYRVALAIRTDMITPDDYFWCGLMIDLMYALKYWIYLIGASALILSLLCFIFLMCAAGKRKGIPDAAPSNLTKLPFEIPTLAVFFAVILSFYVIDAVDHSDVAYIVATVAVLFVWAIMGIFWFMSLAIRIKLGTIFTNTIIYRICRFIWRCLCFVGRCIWTLVRSIPLIWKTVIVFAAISLVEFFIILISRYVTTLMLFWFFGKCIVFVVLMYFVIMLQRLKTCGKEIADGNIDHMIDTKYLILDLKEHAEDLNRIGDGINIAVDERMKSERMKTELITNVSHDIKTPLTSIINYSDLICREECDNENIKEYSAILHNQSERMKRLIDDLVEASKASSGNIDIMLAECDARVLVTQAAGEYSQRLTDAGLELVCSCPENEVKIMADGRRIWRVIDNIMNNARKYALPGTRVYLSLEEIGERVVFRLKNISREPLSVDASELTERFVRGDESRNTEGNGLGLSIAKSLTELQGGTFDITIDGDLFKVTMTFEKVK